MRFGPGLRKLVLTVHILASVGWIGAVAAYLTLDVTVATSEDPQDLRAAYLAMDRTTTWALVPLAFAALATGLLISLGTTWGLFRHWWVLLSLVLTGFAVVILVVESATIAAYAERARDPATTDAELRALPSTLVHSVGGMVVLVVVTVLNIYKPRGLTPYGEEKARGERGGGAG